MSASPEYLTAANVIGTRPPNDGGIRTRHGEETEMLTYPEGLLLISSRHRKEILDEAQRWRLIRRVRDSRRGRHAESDGQTAHRIDDATRRGRIAGWVAAGGRGRVDIPSNPSTRSGTQFGGRPYGPGG
jgi:hypothetical protein